MKYLIFFSIFICQYINAQTSGSTFPTLEDLDKVVAEQQLYVDKHEKTISSIRQKLKNATSEEDRYWLKNDLFSEYISYQVDSALLYAQEKLKSAHIIGKQDYIDDSHINIAYVFILAGMYKEASDMLESIDRSRMEEYLEEYYFSAYNLLYEAMLKYSIGNENKKKYRSKAMAYKDSILLKSDYQNIYIYIYTQTSCWKKGNTNKDYLYCRKLIVSLHPIAPKFPMQHISCLPFIGVWVIQRKRNNTLLYLP